MNKKIDINQENLKIAKSYVKTLLNTYDNIESIFLVGSTALNEAIPGSDIDLILIFNSKLEQKKSIQNMHDESKNINFQQSEIDLYFLEMSKLLDLINEKEIKDVIEYGTLLRIKNGIILYDKLNNGIKIIEKINKTYLSDETFEFLFLLAKKATINSERLLNLGYFESSILSSRFALEVMAAILFTKLGHYVRGVKRMPILMQSDSRLEKFSKFFFQINNISNLDKDYVKEIVKLTQKSLKYTRNFSTEIECDPK